MRRMHGADPSLPAGLTLMNLKLKHRGYDNVTG